MRLAFIDLGTNSIRHDIYQIGRKGAVVRLLREKRMIRLGEGLFESGIITPSAIIRLLHAMEHFKLSSEKLGVHKTIAFGTCALREARNSADLIRLIHNTLGIRTKIISGQEEARLISKGILGNEQHQGRFVLIDIGGGSTEVSFCQDHKLRRCISLPLGVSRLRQNFLPSMPPSHPEKLRNHIRKTLEKLCPKNERFGAEFSVGSSGTIRTLARVLKRHEGRNKMTLSGIKKLRQKMEKMSYEQLASLQGMNPKRVDLIYPGIVLFEEILRYLNVELTRPTSFALRDGILMKFASSSSTLSKKLVAKKRELRVATS